METGLTTGFTPTDDYVHFQFEETRSGQVSRDILGEDFAGTLVTDYSGYEAHSAAAKQKCLGSPCSYGT